MRDMISTQQEIDKNQIEEMLTGNCGTTYFPAIEYLIRHTQRDNSIGAEANKLLLEFLQLPSVFAFIEMHTTRFGHNVTQPFIAAQVAELKQRYAKHQALTPELNFDISENEARLCFYMMRHMIRQDYSVLPATERHALQQDFKFLMDTPEVKNRLHLTVTPGESNELLRLAIRLGRTWARDYLIEIPLVRIVAEANDFYVNEGGLLGDLQRVIRNAESSMEPLSHEEEARLKAVKEHYKGQLKDDNAVNTTIEHLMHTIKALYDENPAVINHEGEKIKLPFHHKDWCELANTLPTHVRREALQAYYQHRTHGAYRYLLRPNPWIHARDALYALHCEDGLMSDSVRFLPLIALLYVAAKDESSKPTDKDITVKARVEGLINELGYINRAHNWDKSRPCTINGKTKSEQYDDLEPDKPSCIDGVKRRLFLSVLAHPMLNLLTKTHLFREAREFVMDQFKAYLSTHQEVVSQLKDAWDLVAETGEQPDVLKQLNISYERQEQFIEDLKTKYGKQLTENETFLSYIKKLFSCQSTFAKSHAACFGCEIDLQKLLHDAEAAKDSIAEIQKPEVHASQI